MGDLLGLSGIEHSGPVLETPDLIEIPTTLAFPVPPPCPKCGKRMHRNGTERIRVWDAPSRGKRVMLDLQKERRRCRDCRHQQTASSPDIRIGYRVLTRRLVRYVENRVVKTTVENVARETGLTADVVHSLALDLDSRLRRQPSHWSTPVAVAVDNIQTAPGSRFQVLFDQIANRPMAIAPTWSLEPILQEVHRHLSIEEVRVFSTDMSDVNLLLAAEFTNAIHVADKFHVFDSVSRAMSDVIRLRVAALKGDGDDTGAQRLASARQTLLGKRDCGAQVAQLDLELETLPDELGQHADVAAAHRVRVQLLRFYASTGQTEARSHLDDLYRRMVEPMIRTAMRPALNYVRIHDAQVFGYIEALDLMGRDLWSPTTTALEQRNGALQEIWRSARGYGTLPMFRLRGVYHPYEFGLHLIDCEGCLGFVGPLTVHKTLSVSQSSARERRLCRRCQDSEDATPHSADSYISVPEYGVAA